MLSSIALKSEQVLTTQAGLVKSTNPALSKPRTRFERSLDRAGTMAVPLCFGAREKLKKFSFASNQTQTRNKRLQTRPKAYEKDIHIVLRSSHTDVPLFLRQL